MAAFAPNDPARALEYFSAKMSFTTGPVELSKAMKNDAVRVVDVRTRDDFAREHIPGSINLPEGDWSKAGERGLAHDKTNVLLCYSQVCHLAARAAVELARQGFPVMELEGGFDGWKKHRLPTEHGDQAHDQPVERARELLSQTREAQKQVAVASDAAKAAAKPAAKADAPEVTAKADAKEEPNAQAENAEPKEEAKPEAPTANAKPDEHAEGKSEEAKPNAPQGDAEAASVGDVQDANGEDKSDEASDQDDDRSPRRSRNPRAAMH